MIFERVLRKTYGPTKECNGTWGIKTNNELNKIIQNRNMNFINSQRLKWFGHVNRMTDEKLVKKIYKLNPLLLTKEAGRLKLRWKDDVPNQ